MPDHTICLGHDRGRGAVDRGDAYGKTIYVPDRSHTTNTARPPIPVGGEPFAMVVTPNGRRFTTSSNFIGAWTGS